MRLEDGPGFFAFVAGEVIEDHDVTRIESWRYLGFDIGLEGSAVHRAVDDPWSGQAITTQGGNAGLGFPVAEGSAGLEALIAARPSAQPRHLRRGCRLIDNDQPVRLLAQAGLPVNTPSLTRLGNVIASAFRCRQRF